MCYVVVLCVCWVVVMALVEPLCVSIGLVVIDIVVVGDDDG